MIGQAHRFQQLWSHMGPKWMAYRLGYAARLRTGQLRRQLPAADWDSRPLSEFLDDMSLGRPETYLDYQREQAPAFFFTPAHREEYQAEFAKWDAAETTTPILLTQKLAEGYVRYFEHTYAQIGFPPDWHADPFNGERAKTDLHWSQISDFGSSDIKVIWEPSRFNFTYALVRAYWRTGDESYAELFWQLVEDWRISNPPQLGANWKCGQEISFRVMAWCFGLHGFLKASVTSAQRVASLVQMIAVSGERIEANLGYALSQHNNHGISEAVGLWTIGSLFPKLRSAERCRESCREPLEELGRELSYTDGSFVQHSVNYQRLMLHDYLWAMRLAELHGRPFSDELKERVSRACDFLFQIQDEESGRVPCYGQNDGALILPLNNCDYQNFRPVIQAIRYLCTATRSYDNGPWDEDLLWLFGLDALNAPLKTLRRDDLRAEIGGYYTLRSQTSFAFIRCATFRDRPGQADILHLDLWWRGQNIALDAGTYSYNAPAPWDNRLAHTAYHNTVTVDGLNQMDQAGKFLWLPWLHSSVNYQKRSRSENLAYWEGEHDGYQRIKQPVSQRRAILRLGDEWWLVSDALNSNGSHDYRLQWLLPDLLYEWEDGLRRIALKTPAGAYYIKIATSTGNETCSVVKADQDSPRGWRAPYYHEREPALSVDAVTHAASQTFWTLFGPEPGDIKLDENIAHVETEGWQATLRFQAESQRPLIESVIVHGTLEDKLEIS